MSDLRHSRAHTYRQRRLHIRRRLSFAKQQDKHLAADYTPTYFLRYFHEYHEQFGRFARHQPFHPNYCPDCPNRGLCDWCLSNRMHKYTRLENEDRYHDDPGD